MTRTTGGLEIRENVRLSRYTTIEVGGPARYFAVASRDEEVLEALDFASSRSLPLFVLGGGSNVLVSDAGFPGLVLRVAMRGLTSSGAERHGRFTAAAGEEWDGLVQWCVELSLAGLECMSGIPGSVGAAPVQNIGAYGQEVGQTITALRALDRQTRRIVELPGRQCRFGYRSSIFNSTDRDRYVILSVSFALRVQGESCLKHGELQQRFQDASLRPTIREVREAVLSLRRAKGMLISPQDPDSKSLGSFFKNPIVSGATLRRAEEQGRRCGRLSPDEVLPRFEAPEGWKVPAAFLIERAGFPKGHGNERAGISSKHALSLVNRGRATGQDVWMLASSIQAAVRNVFGIELVPEAVLVGFDRRGQP
jgi:UDP-N-acetylmuramate dehydrogenase